MACEAVLGTETAWVSDIDKGACKILAHRFPGVPNIGDMTAVDWSQVEPVDVLTGGTPCQDLSHAGKRAGMTEGTRSNLWVAMREAIATIRPGLVVWENVGGAYSAEADSELVNDPRLLAGTRRRDGEPVLRALGRVLGDLDSLGYVGGWHGLRAADVGAPHGRLRVFVVAVPAAESERRRWKWRGPVQLDGPPVDIAGNGAGSLLPSPTVSDANGAGVHGDGGLDLRTAVTMLPTPRATDQRDDATCLTGALLPTPAVNDMGEGKTVEAWDEWTAKMKAAHGNGNGHGASLSIEAQRLLPTPKATNNENRPSDGFEENRWGRYAAAITRWESLTRPAPPPTETGPKGNPRLSAAFSEWMMNLPAGWVTDVPGITRNEALKAIGNGVVPPQAEAALRFLLMQEAVA